MNNKFTFNIENVSLTIEGQPIQLGGINIEINSEASVHELATSASMIKDLVNQIKDMVRIPASAPTPYPTAPTPVPMPAPTVNVVTKPVAEAPTAPAPLDLRATFEGLEERLIKMEGWSTDHLGNLYWQGSKDSDIEFKDAKVSLEDAIRVHIHSTRGILRNIHIAIHPKKVYVDGISTHYLEKFLRESGIPGLEELLPVVENMEVRS